MKVRQCIYIDGSWIKDENYDVALFNELGSAPATMQAGKVVDAYGLQIGYVIEQADAEAAYTQCELKGPKPGSDYRKTDGQMNGLERTETGKGYASTTTRCVDCTKLFMGIQMREHTGTCMPRSI